MNVKKMQSGFSLPELGLGTAHIGGGRKPDYSHDKQNVTALKEAILSGYIHIDTSELYGGGHSEELIRESISFFKREKLTISTKVYKNHLRGWRLKRSVRRSLKRLGVDYIDLYSIHAPNPKIPLRSTFQALDELVSEGIIRNIGVSNYSVELLKEAQALTKNKIVSNQIEYNLSVREKSQFENVTKMESEIIPYCQEHDILVVAVCPIGRGNVLKTNQLMDDLAAKYNKTYIQIALNWLLSQKNIVAVSKSTNLEHLQENLGATGWHMEQGDVEKLKNDYPSDRLLRL